MFRDKNPAGRDFSPETTGSPFLSRAIKKKKIISIQTERVYFMDFLLGGTYRWWGNNPGLPKFEQPDF